MKEMQFIRSTGNPSMAVNRLLAQGYEYVETLMGPVNPGKDSYTARESEIVVVLRRG